LKLFIIIIFIFCGFSTFSQESHHNWLRLGGKWKVTNSKAIEERAWSIVWGYYELVNFNSILSLKPFCNYSSIEVEAELFEREKSPTEFILAFNVTSESSGWYYHMYAFRITGGFWGMNKIALIYSDREDKSKPFNTKNNTFIKELKSVNHKIKYGKVNNYRISFENSDVILYINGEKVLSAPFPEKSYDGRVAICSRNIKISIDKITIKNAEKIIFEDDFDIDSIYVKIVKAKKVPISNGVKVESKATDKT